MLSLYKIRYQFLKRHPCGLCLGYLFIPIILIVVFLPIAIIVNAFDTNRRYRYSFLSNSEKNQYQYSLYHEDKKFFNNFALENLQNSAILVNNIENGEKLSKFIKNEINIQMDYFLNEKELNQKNYDSIIIYTEKDGKNEFNLKIKEKFDTNFIIFNKIINNLKNIFPYYKTKKNLQNFEKQINFQSLIIKFLLNQEKKDKFPKITVNTDYKNFDLSRIDYDDRDTNDIIMGAVFSFEMSLFSYYFTEKMIEEKEKKLNDFLERQGISKKKYILSWFVTYTILSILPFVGFLCLSGALLRILVLFGFLNLVLYFSSIYSVIFFFYTTISSIKKGSIIIKIFNFVSTVAGCVLSLPGSFYEFKYIFVFSPFVNIYYATSPLYRFSSRRSIDLGDLVGTPVRGMRYIETVGFFIGQIIFYSLSSLFIQSYKNSGLSFCLFLKSFFCKVSRNIKNLNEQPLIGNENENTNILNYEIHHQQLSLIDQQKKNQNNCLSIVGATKKFENLIAVNNFNCDLFTNEIFCLLGHNGAGKTTLVNMISGLMDPEEGDIFLDGASLVTNKDLIYRNIGLCQQQDILFDYLTVQEHLQYIYDIKGIPRNFNEIQELIVKLDLSAVQTNTCDTLSGGQKRKLSIALALLSGGKITILDEPTSGMDIIAKKKLWEFLKGYQKDKILLITTHSLEEAEYLGNRIGIMSDGRLICSGTSSYLKSKYPCGININLVINSKLFNENNKNIIFEKIKEYDPKAEIKVASKGLFSINIQENNEHISEIFDCIEECKAQYGIEDYIVGSASLEDVFLKINNKSNIKNMTYTNQNIDNNFVIPQNRPQPAGFCSQLKSQLFRDLLPIFRNKSLFFLEFIGGLICSYLITFFVSGVFFRDNLYKNSFNNNMNRINSISLYGYEEGYLKNSDFYKKISNNLNFKRILESSKDNNNFKNEDYNLLSNNDKAYISIKKNNEGDIEVYNKEIENLLDGYLYSNSILITSAILKNEFGINATIFIENENKSFLSKSFDSDLTILLVFGVSIVFGYIIYLGGVVYEKIKDRKTKTKYLLYLSGCNMWSYWCAFFLIDFTKLLIFSMLMMLPIYFISNLGLLYFYCMPMMCMSSLIFIYFFSSFWEDEDSGTKILLMSIIGTVIGLYIIYSFILIPLSLNFKFIFDISIGFINKRFFFSLLDITPISSFALTFFRISYSNSLHLKKDDNIVDGYFNPIFYVYTGIMNHIINFIFYLNLMILNERGYLGRFFNSMHSDNASFVFSEEMVAEEFYANNNLRNPLLFLQNEDMNNYNNNLNNNNINNTNNNNNNNIINNANINNNNIINNNNNINNNSDNNIINNFNNINSINNSRSQSQSSIDIDTSSEKNINNINNNSNNQNYQINQINNINNNSNNQNYQINQINNQFNYADLDNNQLDAINQNQFVAAEIRKIKTNPNLSTKIEGLYKTFFNCCKKNVRVVNNLYLGLEPNEKFGLLGFNGSGKTTTFRAITNEVLYEKGKVTLFGYDGKNEFDQLRPMVGYCPQENPLFDFMKVREIIYFYLKLKNSTETIESICSMFNLSKYLDTYCKNLSGGNKRKLTFAIALMNKPNLLLLDEPSTGVDPESRRIMWKNINELTNTGHKYNMILTTHSIEEAEVLCDRVSWLKKGNFVCIGNPEQLKLKYSNGYKLHIKFVDTVVNKKDVAVLTRKMVQDEYITAIRLIQDFNRYSNYIFANPIITLYIRALNNVIREIKPNTLRIRLLQIEKDFSFEFEVGIVKQRQRFLFSQIFNMKNKNPQIAEISINLDSLGNILTLFS